MAFDIFAMYLSHYHIQKVQGHRGTYSSHSLDTLKSFLMKEWLLVLHHLSLLVIFLPITLVSRARGCVPTCDCCINTLIKHSLTPQFFRRGLGDFFVGCLFTTEFSTPFISLGKILIQVKSFYHSVVMSFQANSFEKGIEGFACLFLFWNLMQKKRIYRHFFL